MILVSHSLKNFHKWVTLKENPQVCRFQAGNGFLIFGQFLGVAAVLSVGLRSSEFNGACVELRKKAENPSLFHCPKKAKSATGT